MPITVNENGTLYGLSEVWVNESGTLYELDTVHSNESGTLYEIHSAWKPPDTLTWKSTSGGTATVSPSNNGYKCTITWSTSSSNGQRFDFTLTKPTRFTATLDTYSDTANAIQALALDGTTVTSSALVKSCSADVTDAGSHYISIQTLGNPVTFSITAEKI